MRSPLRRFAEPVGLVGAGVVVTLALIEGLVRMFLGWFPGPVQLAVQATPGNFGRADAYIGHLHRPNLRVAIEGIDFRAIHDTDGRGFRNPWPWPARADIVVIGDSLTYGYGVNVDDAWPSILRRALRDTRIVNLGLIGAGPQQYLRVYEVFGAPLHPKLLLVGVFAENDFEDARFFDAWLRSGVGGNYIFWRDSGRPDPSRHGSTARLRGAAASVYAVARQSYLFNLAQHTWRSGKHRERRETVYTFPDGTTIDLLPDGFEKRTAGSVPGRPEYDLAVEAFRRIAEQAEQNGTKVLMVLQPSKEEIHLPLLGVRTRDPAQSLRPAFAESGIEYIDLSPVFAERAQRGQRLFFEEDNHPNAAGYRLIAETILQHLKSRALGEKG